MEILAYACLGFSLTALAVQIGSCALASLRCRPSGRPVEPVDRPAITIVRPVCGIEPYSRETLGSTFRIDYPQYEVLFCLADEADPILPLLRALIDQHPHHNARILIGTDTLGENPKLNNMAKGFREARFDHIVFVDSNVLTPPGYLDQLAAALEGGAGMVSAPPVGLAPEGFWAEVECAFLNAYQARMQYAVDSLGLGFAQGKTLFFRRADLEHGGLARLATEPAEDAAATKMIRSKGLHIRLTGPFPQLIGHRTWPQMWKRQIRWARLRRASFPLLYAPEVLAGSLPPLLTLLYGLHALELDVPGLTLLFIALWYGPEFYLVRTALWPRSIPAMLLRDLLLPFVFITACAGRGFEWHGHRMTTSKTPPAGKSRWRAPLRKLRLKLAGRD
jgi:ceramide glucosyltransferase